MLRTRGSVLAGDDDQCSRDQFPAKWRPAAPLGDIPLRPGRLDKVKDGESGGDTFTHPVPDGPMVFDVADMPGCVRLDVGAAIEVGRQHPQPRLGRVIQNTKRPPGRSTLATSRMSPAESATNGTTPYAVNTVAKVASAKGSRVPSH